MTALPVVAEDPFVAHGSSRRCYVATTSSLPLVTAVITTHARPQDVCDALASVCAETYPNIECLVVDDGGTFRLPESRLAREVRVLAGEMRGVAGARNVGLAAARGEFIIFLDDDDVALPNRIATLVAATIKSACATF